jgi:hypothetical protein
MRRSRMRFIIYLNTAPIAWFLRKENTVKSSVFGLEFVALKSAVVTIQGIRYKLRMMGIGISGPKFGFGDNMSMINNTSKPDS